MRHCDTDTVGASEPTEPNKCHSGCPISVPANYSPIIQLQCSPTLVNLFLDTCSVKFVLANFQSVTLNVTMCAGVGRCWCWCIDIELVNYYLTL